MADYDSSLPVKTQGDATAKLQARIIDESADANGLAVTAGGLAKVLGHGLEPDDSTEQHLRVSELGNINGDGIYHVTNNSKPAASGMVAHVRNATPDETHQTIRVTGVNASTVWAMDIALRRRRGRHCPRW